MARMIIEHECIFCGEYVDKDQPHEYTINIEGVGKGRRKVKYFFHSACWDVYNNKEPEFED